MSFFSQLIEPSKLKDVFQESLETDVLAGIVAVLTRDQFVASGDRCLLAWLLGLAQVKRVRAVTLFLPSDRKSRKRNGQSLSHLKVNLLVCFFYRTRETYRERPRPSYSGAIAIAI